MGTLWLLWSHHISDNICANISLQHSLKQCGIVQQKHIVSPVGVGICFSTSLVVSIKKKEMYKKRLAVKVYFSKMIYDF